MSSKKKRTGLPRRKPPSVAQEQLPRRASPYTSVSYVRYIRSLLSRSRTSQAAADSNRIIAAASLRLNQPDAALQSALKARAIEPNNPQTYRQIAEAYLGQQKAEEAAITLAEGAFATGSEELRGDLIKLYQQTDVDTRKCAVVAGPRGPALNPNCEILHRDLCQATTRAHRLDLRRQLSCSN